MSTGGFADDQTQSRRLAILRLLVENEGAANESTLKVGLTRLGFRGRFNSEPLIRSDLKHLQGHDLVTIEMYRDVMVAEITAHGVAFTARETDPVEGVLYPKIGG